MSNIDTLKLSLFWFVCILAHLQGIQNELQNREPEVRLLFERGQRFMDQSPSDATSAGVPSTLDAVKAKWRSVRDEASDKASKLREASKRSEVFNTELETMLAWLAMSEDKIASVSAVGVSRDAVARQLTDVQAVQADMQRKTRNRDALAAAAKTLQDSCGTDKDAISRKMDDVETRWNRLVAGKFHLFS